VITKSRLVDGRGGARPSAPLERLAPGNCYLDAVLLALSKSVADAFFALPTCGTSLA
jgi:hypothetical protein